MFEILKAIHLLCLMLGGAASLGSAVLMRRVMAAGAPPPPMVADAMKVLGNMGFGAILVLWATGVPLAIMTGAFATGGGLFSVKLLVATAVLILVPLMIWLRTEAAAGRRPMNLVLMMRLAMAVRWLVVAAILLAVVIFK